MGMLRKGQDEDSVGLSAKAGLRSEPARVAEYAVNVA
jgi:hypothetical protein